MSLFEPLPIQTCRLFPSLCRWWNARGVWHVQSHPSVSSSAGIQISVCPLPRPMLLTVSLHVGKDWRQQEGMESPGKWWGLPGERRPRVTALLQEHSGVLFKVPKRVGCSEARFSCWDNNQGRPSPMTNGCTLLFLQFWWFFPQACSLLTHKAPSRHCDPLGIVSIVTRVSVVFRGLKTFEACTYYY